MSQGLRTTKAQDQPSHLGSLISSFVIHSLESIIYKLVTCEISILWQVSEAEETGLSVDLSETPKVGFVASGPTFLKSLLEASK